MIYYGFTMPAGRKGEWFASQEAPPHIWSGWRIRNCGREKEEVRILEHRSAQRSGCGSEKRRCTDTPKVTTAESADTHTWVGWCVFIIRKMATTYDHRSVTRERKTFALFSRVCRQSATESETLEGPARWQLKAPRATGGPPRPKWSQQHPREPTMRERWVGVEGRCAFCAFWLLNFCGIAADLWLGWCSRVSMRVFTACTRRGMCFSCFPLLALANYARRARKGENAGPVAALGLGGLRLISSRLGSKVTRLQRNRTINADLEEFQGWSHDQLFTVKAFSVAKI